MNELLAQFDGLGKPQMLVVGDVMLDRYTWGDVERRVVGKADHPLHDVDDVMLAESTRALLAYSAYVGALHLRRQRARGLNSERDLAAYVAHAVRTLIPSGTG